MAKKKKGPSRYEQRRMRTQQIIFTIIAAIIIFTFVIGMIAR